MIKHPGRDVIAPILVEGVLVGLVIVVSVVQRSRWVARRSGVSVDQKWEPESLCKQPPLTPYDRLWHVVGLGRTNGPTDLSENIDEYLAQSYRAEIHNTL